MASETSKILISFKAAGDEAVYNAFKKLGRESRTLEKNFKTLDDQGIKKIRNEFNKMAKGSANSLQAMRAQKNALMGLRDQADVTGLEFKQLTADIAALDARMRKAGAGATGFKSRLKGFAKGAGAIAAGGIFGGPEGAVGGAIGLKVGGPAGAAVGAAIGAQVGMVRQQISALAEYSAALGLQRKALRLVIGDTAKFNKSQKFLLQTSRDLAIPQEVITRQFTSLTASVVGAGQSVSDAEKVFEAIAAGIRGTGGNLEDMKAAMRATSQVFSKGKVSAEELRQQLGERLPGAFTLFAKSMDKTPAELDKALEQGKVTLDDFMGFANLLFTTYGENAKVLAKGPEAAGDRLTTAMSELKDSIGQILLPIGAAFQETFSRIVEDINKAIEKFKEFFGIGLENAIKLAEKNIESLEKRLLKSRVNSPTYRRLQRQLKAEEANLGGLLLQREEEGQGGDKEKTDDLTNSLNNATKASFSFKEELRKAYDAATDLTTQIGKIGLDAINKMADGFAELAVSGKASFGELARSILKDLQKMIIRALFFKAIVNFLPGLGSFLGLGSASTTAAVGGEVTMASFNAKGNVYDKGLKKFAKGGIVTQPQLFAYGSGGTGKFGLMGEAGAEAIMPLKRGSDGKLGVQSSGGVGNIVVNVDASGSSVEGDEQRGSALGRLIAEAIQSELIEQRRPGGLLA